MPPVKINGIEQSPCIVAKAKFALGLTTHHPTNKKTCSIEYWNKIVNYLGKELPNTTIHLALRKTNLFLKN